MSGEHGKAGERARSCFPEAWVRVNPAGQLGGRAGGEIGGTGRRFDRGGEERWTGLPTLTAASQRHAG